MEETGKAVEYTALQTARAGLAYREVRGAMGRFAMRIMGRAGRRGGR